MKLRYRILTGLGVVLALAIASLAITVSYDSPCGGPAAVLHGHHPVQPRGEQRQEGLSQQLHPRPARRLHRLRETRRRAICQ